MKKEFINPEGVWKPTPPFRFSQGVKITGGSLVLLAGQVSVDGEGKTVGVGDARAQTRQILEDVQMGWTQVVDCVTRASRQCHPVQRLPTGRSVHVLLCKWLSTTSHRSLLVW